MSTAARTRQQRFHIVGTSPAAQSLRTGILSAASSRTHVLIAGESGVGKRHVAKQIHYASSEAPGAFYEVYPETPDAEVMAVLFNEDRKRVEGMVRTPLPFLTDTATVFVKNIHRFSVAGQSWIGRAMMQSSMGKHSPRFRVILSIPAPWPELIKGRFISLAIAEAVRSSEHIFVPPLRERIDDIPAFIHEFVEERALMSHPKAGSETLRELSSYSWYDNVRELRHLIEEAMTISPGDELILPTGFVDEITAIRETLSSIMNGKKVVLPAVLESIEKSLLRRALLKTNFDKLKAGSLLGVTNVCVGYRLRKHEFHHPEVTPLKSRTKVKALK